MTNREWLSKEALTPKTNSISDGHSQQQKPHQEKKSLSSLTIKAFTKFYFPKSVILIIIMKIIRKNNNRFICFRELDFCQISMFLSQLWNYQANIFYFLFFTFALLLLYLCWVEFSHIFKSGASHSRSIKKRVMNSHLPLF